jgi:hypothetical protein
MIFWLHNEVLQYSNNLEALFPSNLKRCNDDERMKIITNSFRIFHHYPAETTLHIFIIIIIYFTILPKDISLTIEHSHFDEILIV